LACSQSAKKTGHLILWWPICANFNPKICNTTTMDSQCNDTTTTTQQFNCCYLFNRNTK